MLARETMVAAAVLAAISIHPATPASTVCPYGKLPSAFNSVIVSDPSLCPPTNLTCVVDRSCKYIGGSDTVSWNAIGDYSGLPPNRTAWSFNGGAVCVNVNAAQFPSTITTLKLSNMTFPPDLVKPTWPAKLKELFIETTNISTIPTNLPSTLSLLFLGGNYLVDAAELNYLPRSVTQLSLENNDYTALANLDWSNMTQVYLSRNPKLKALSNITFSSKIKNLNLENLSLTSWIMDPLTFVALNSSLQPNNTAEDSTFTDGSKAFTGYNYYNLAITTSMSECSSYRGTLTELWPDKRFRNFKYKDSVFTVCVLPSAATTAVPTASRTPGDEGGGLGTSAIVGLAAGVGIVVVGAVIFVCVRRRRAAKPKSPVFETMSTPGTLAGTATSIDVNMNCLQLVRISNNELVVGPQIGAGAFASVHKGQFQGRAVAVKVLLKDRITTAYVQSFVDEIVLMSQFDSPHVVNLIGAAWTRVADVKCVMELMDGGDLKDFLDHHTPAQFPWADKYIHVLSIVDGLSYLHSMNIVHRDLKSRNVLLDSTKGTKLTDFGISKEDIQATMTVGVGTFRWMAPEMLQDKGYGVSADMYSFGMVLSEFDTHRTPYVDLKNPITRQPLADSAIILKVVSGSIRPTFTSDCPAWIVDLASKCLLLDPSQRPTAMQVSHTIRSKLKELSTRLFSI
ncbi:TKL protein kinase, variant [Aphanomyces invadans]|uniref:TKL protein kinase, variant n=1 Tax=Aphanomyces invadans TaxID=157072 RepID=A0A024TG27_9STRA|nr:TKL protein kinase, variant [Aphanomyces invadans]ETV92302.1 TKL protein kinase, variant [Aphanomyces invadans]|eukprot:XP_008879053.1 TKL protein kinase, variant [Aphanomyces invadans]